jgi:hypothetical protein
MNATAAEVGRGTVGPTPFFISTEREGKSCPQPQRFFVELLQ